MKMSIKEHLQEIFKKLPLKKQHLYIIAGILALLLLYHIVSNILAKPDIVKEVPYVRTVTVGKETVDETSSYPGEVRGRYESNLAFQAAGKIISRSVNLGDTVTAGEVLMRIDPQDIEQSVEASQAAVASAEANYKLAKDNASRYTTLYNSGGVSKAMMEQYNTQMEAAASTLRQSRAQLIANSNQLSYTQLVADHDGVVANVSGEVGQVVAAGTPVVTVVQSGEQEVQIYIPENHLDKIHPNQTATINFWALTNVTADGYVREIAPMADSVTRTYKVRVAVPHMPAPVKLGMTAKVHLQSGTESGIMLPAAAIYQTASEPQVWLVNGTKVHTQKVTIGGYEGNNVKITSGLDQGDIVVVGGVNKLSEEQTVRLEAGAGQ